MRRVWPLLATLPVVVWGATWFHVAVGFGVAVVVGFACAWLFWRAGVRWQNEVDESQTQREVAMTEVRVLTERCNTQSARWREELGVLQGQLNAEHARTAVVQQALDDARASRASFLATVSHELRTPLHAIIGFSELVADGCVGPVNESQREYLNDAKSAATHLVTLISDVLDYAKSDAGKLSFAKELVTVGRVLPEVTTIVEGLATKKELTVTGSCEEGALLVGDSLRLKQVLVNLVGNAVKFTPKRGRVDVSAKAVSGQCVITVRDTGLGISDDQLPSLFEPFQQGDSSTVRQHAGTGLGLALVKRWTEAMAGTVEVESKSGKGACFTLRFPLPDLTKLDPKADSAGQRIDVLVAEDDDATRVMLARVLEAQGFSVRQASNGQRALEAVMARVPQVLILDLMMPELDGYELLKKLRGLPGVEATPVLIFSAANPQGVERDRLIRAGAQLFVKGSLSPSQLASKVREVAAKARPRSAA
jgi:signal transduction histidine kinase/CheY-like chemotaxis protein